MNFKFHDKTSFELTYIQKIIKRHLTNVLLNINIGPEFSIIVERIKQEIDIYQFQKKLAKELGKFEYDIKIEISFSSTDFVFNIELPKERRIESGTHTEIITLANIYLTPQTPNDKELSEIVNYIKEETGLRESLKYTPIKKHEQSLDAVLQSIEKTLDKE